METLIEIIKELRAKIADLEKQLEKSERTTDMYRRLWVELSEEKDNSISTVKVELADGEGECGPGCKSCK